MTISNDREIQRTQNEQALLDKLQSKELRMKFDGTINVNTVVAAASLLVSGALAYATLDKRIAIIEQVAQDRIIRLENEVLDLKKEIKELTRALNNAQKDRS
jgi:hypothetical protein